MTTRPAASLWVAFPPRVHKRERRADEHLDRLRPNAYPRLPIIAHIHELEMSSFLVFLFVASTLQAQPLREIQHERPYQAQQREHKVEHGRPEIQCAGAGFRVVRGGGLCQVQREPVR